MRKYYLFMLLIGIYGFIISEIQAQELISSAPFATGLSLQPAFCGVYEGDWRLSMHAFNRNIVQNQSQNGKGSILEMNHYSMQLERDIKNKWFAGAGGLWLDSERYPGLSVQHAQGVLAYEVPLGTRARYHRLRAGFQGGAIQYVIDPQSFSFEDQFDGRDFSRTSAQNNAQESIIRYDMSVGLMMYRLQKIRGNPEFNYYGGLALRHLNRPQIGFFSTQTNELSLQTVAQGGGVVRTRSAWELLGGMTLQHQNARTNYMGQLYARYSLHEGNSILGKRLLQMTFGTLYRPNYSWSIVTGLSWEKNWRVAFVYDIRNSSNAMLTNERGGLGVVVQALWGGIKDENLNQQPFPDF